MLFPDLPHLIELLRLGRFILVAIVLYDVGTSINFHCFLSSCNVMQNPSAQAASQPWCETAENKQVLPVITGQAEEQRQPSAGKMGNSLDIPL